MWCPSLVCSMGDPPCQGFCMQLYMWRFGGCLLYCLLENRLFMVLLAFSGPSVKNQGITASPHCGRFSVAVTCVVLAVLIALVGVGVCRYPLPFANDWQHWMCSNSIPWPWSRVESDTCTATGMHNICVHLVTVSVISWMCMSIEHCH